MHLSSRKFTRAAEKRITHQSDDDLHRVNEPIRSLISGLACPVKDITQEKTIFKKSNIERIFLLSSLTSSKRGF